MRELSASPIIRINLQAVSNTTNPHDTHLIYAPLLQHEQSIFHLKFRKEFGVARVGYGSVLG